MKANRATYWTAVCAAAVTATAVFRASAEQTATTARPEKSYTGKVVSVDPREHVLSVREWALSKKAFNLGDNCAYMLLENNSGTANDLRPGEKVTVTYQNSHGVLIADRIAQQPVRFTGTVTTFDPDKRTLTLHRQGMDKQLQIADGCKIVLRDEKPGTLADIQTGNYVTVTYETPGGMPTAREIAQTSMAYTGTLTAIDLGEKTLKARALFETKKFNVADNCAIVINGKTDGKLSDLKPNDRLVFNYDEINGINVVNRIAPGKTATEPPATASSQTHDTGTPYSSQY